MSKRNDMIKVLENNLSNCSSTYPAYIHGRIPSKVMRGALSSYGGAINSDDVLGLIDTTILESGKTGVLFTENNVYYSGGMLGDTGYVSYTSLSNGEYIPAELLSSIYNASAMKQILGKLTGIATYSVKEDLNNTMQSISDSLDEWGEIAEKGMKLFNGVMSILKSNNENDKKE